MGECVRWIHLIKDKVKWWTVANVITNARLNMRNYIPSDAKSSAAQPLAWLPPMIKILFLCGSETHLFLIFTVAVFSTKPGKWEASDSSWWLSGSVKRFTIVAVVHLAARCMSILYSWLFSSCLEYSSQDHCLEYLNHKRRFYLVCLQWCSVLQSLSLLVEIL